MEALARGGVTNADPEVVDAAVWSRAVALSVNASALLPSGSSRNPP
jgi:hypothetical protein